MQGGGHGSLPPGERMCHPCRRINPQRKQFEPRECALPDCAVMFTPKQAGRAPGYTLYCSRSCGAKASNRAAGRDCSPESTARSRTSRKAAVRRRRMRHAESWDGVTDDQILARDRWRCGICRKVIGKTFRFPHPRSASIDHVIPLSEGGDDTAANKRAAHLGCNVARGNRGGGEQLAMVG